MFLFIRKECEKCILKSFKSLNIRMPKIQHTLNDYIKQALWAVYKKRCFYCGEPLAYKNIQIDHVIPVASFMGHEEEIRQNYLLNLEFNFNSLDNFVPSCPSCNYSKKREKELQKGIPIWLDFCQTNKNKILKEAKKIERRLSFDLSDDTKEFFLSSPDFLKSNLQLDRVRKVDIPLYKNLIFSDYGMLELVSGDDDNIKILIKTLNEYELYSRKGYYALTTSNIARSSVCESCLMFFDYLTNAVAVEMPIEFRAYFMDLPAMILRGQEDSEQEDIINDQTIKEFYEDNSQVQILFTDKEIELKLIENDSDRGIIFTISEVLQADFSGDGYREALLFIHYQSQGTLNFTYHCHVSQYKDTWRVLSA